MHGYTYPGGQLVFFTTPNHSLMKTKVLLFSVLAAALLIVGCRKDGTNDDPAPSPTPSSNAGVFRSWFAQHVEDAAQLFAINASVGGEVEGTDGVTLIFEPNAFLHADGTPVSGAVEVSLVEALTIGDMIWLNKQTVGNDNGTLRMLRSGGEIRVLATQGGEELRVVDGGMLVVVPAESIDPAMELFSGREDNAGRMIWAPLDSVIVTANPDSISDGYGFYPDSLEWLNCDYFFTYPSTTTLDVTIPAGQPSDSTMVWIAFPTENAIMEMQNVGSQTYRTMQVVPVGMQAVVIGLYRNGTSYYSSFSTGAISVGTTIPMTFEATTLPQFFAVLNAL